MLSIFLIYYFFGKTTAIIFVLLSYFMSLFIFTKSMKCYFPKMKSKENQFFHDDYPEFMKFDLHFVSFGRIFFGILSFFWLRLATFSLIIVSLYSTLRSNFGLKKSILFWKEF